MSSGEVLGATSPFAVSTPWWQDVEPIGARLPDLAILRLLRARTTHGAIVGGDVTYLAEPLDQVPASLELQPRAGELPDDPLRMSWAREGGPRGDLAWATSVVGAHGKPTQHRTWNLSSIWSLPMAEGESWLKCVPSFFQHEALVLRRLAGGRVPRLLAAEDHRMLLAALPGEDGYHSSLEQRRDLIDELVAMQVASAPNVEQLLADGVPDGRADALVEAASAVVHRRAPGDAMLRGLIERAPVRLAALVECGLPDVLVHGDAHGGNARVGPGAGRGLWFDWGDSRIGCPVLDVAVLERPGEPFANELMAHWLRAWATAIPGCDPERAWRLLRPLAALGAAVVFQSFLDRIEASERVYHEGDVLPWLELAARLAEAEHD